MAVFGKIGKRLLSWFVLVALIPLLFMGYQGYYFARLAVKKEAYLHIQAISQQKKSQIEQWFAERRADTEVLSANPSIVEACQLGAISADNRRSLERLLDSYKAQSQAYEFICVYSISGTMLACTKHTDETLAEMHDFVLEAMNSSQPLTSPIHLHNEFGLTIHLSGRVTNEFGKPVGVVITTLGLAYTLNPIILDTTGLGFSGQAYLVDKNKVMLTPSRFMNHPKPLTHTMDSRGIQLALQGSSGVELYHDFEGRDVIGAWDFLPNEQWALITEIDANEAFASLQMLRRNAMLVAIGTLGLILIVVAFISRTLSKPIRELANASSAVSKGDLGRRVAIQLNDELGDLAASFNQMVQSLKDSQKQLVQSERLAAIGELVASVVHEIRNPLSAIKMNLRILETKDLQGELVHSEHFQLAKSQTERIETMLTELLDYSKTITIQKRNVTVLELFNRVSRDFSTLLDERNAVLHARHQNPLDVVSVDDERFMQVFWNLITNSLQAIDASGRSDGKIELISESSPHATVLSIKDNGMGLQEESVKHVFEPFFTTRKNGTGLGLAIAKKIVDAHEGHITFRSRMNEGSEISISLPRST
ncbi:sensor histidine kinase [bacterium]|nr:sensor histidine kinase [bacterium]